MRNRSNAAITVGFYCNGDSGRICLLALIGHPGESKLSWTIQFKVGAPVLSLLSVP